MKISNEMAECLGIIVGDGSLSVYDKSYDYKVQVSGNKTEDIEYFNYLENMFYDLFKVKPKIKIEEDEIRLIINRKKVLEKLESYGLKRGKKARTVRIPSYIIKDNKLATSFLRGLIDTDGCMTFKKKKNNYPVVEISSASKYLIYDVCKILNGISIKFCNYSCIRNTSFGRFRYYAVDINGKENLTKWAKFIGFSNTKHLTKIKVWEKLGYCPPNTNIKERYNLLNNKI